MRDHFIVVQSSFKFYASGVRRYVNFCSRSGKFPFSGVVSAFVAMLAKEGICFATIIIIIRTYLSAVRHFQTASGQGDPGIPQMAHLEWESREIEPTVQQSLERNDN